MSKRNKIIYWIATVWLAFGMAFTGFMQLLQGPNEADMFARLGYPGYLMLILGVWKILGAVAVLVPNFPLFKEWAYAGFFFIMSGAIVSHLAIQDAAVALFGPSLLIVLTIVSWYFRPVERKTATV